MNGLFVAPLIQGTLKNIGDYIQSIAQEQFWDRIDCYVEREKLASFKSKEKVNLIMQGWFMWTAEQFPPSSSINPFFISFHLSPYISEKLLTPISIAYFKQYEPIGCRDYYTQRMLESKGIKCYFSGCLTLTLGLKYLSSKHNDNIYIVDPYFERGGSKVFSRFKRMSIVCITSFKYYSKVKIIRKKYKLVQHYKKNKFIQSWIDAASFYYTYSKVFSDEVLLCANYLSHIITETGMTEDDKLELAREYVKKYASAKMVITSRLHAALPAIATETPVIFCNSAFLENKGSHGAPAMRFGGLLDLMHYINITPKGITPGTNTLKRVLSQGKIGINISIKNPDTYKIIRDDLIKRVNAFVNKCKSLDSDK